MKAKTAIAVKLKFENGYAHIDGYLVMADLRANGDLDFAHYDSQTPLHGFQFSSQADRSGTANGGLYALRFGMSTHYDMTELSQAIRAVRVLKPIQAKLEKMEVLEGNAASFGAWVNRLVRATGSNGIYVKRDEPRREHHISDYVHYSVGDTVTVVDKMVAKIHEWQGNAFVRAVA